MSNASDWFKLFTPTSFNVALSSSSSMVLSQFCNVCWSKIALPLGCVSKMHASKTLKRKLNFSIWFGIWTEAVVTLLFEQRFRTSNILAEQRKQIPCHVELKLYRATSWKFCIQNHAVDEKVVDLLGNHPNCNVEDVRRQFRFQVMKNADHHLEF